MSLHLHNVHAGSALVARGVAVVHPGVAAADDAASIFDGVDVTIVDVVVVMVVPRVVIGADQVDVAAVAA